MTTGAPRLFVALELPGHARAVLAGWARRVAGDGVRLVPEQNLHVTLAFLGPRQPQDGQTATRALTELSVCGGSLHAAGALWLPPRRAGALTIAVRREPWLVGLQEAVVASLEGALDWRRDPRRFRPHITVGRVRHTTPVRATAPDCPAPQIACVVRSLGLFRSYAGPEGSRYESLARIGLIDA